MSIATLADIEALERNPLEHYRPNHSVFELLMRIAASHADKLAMRYLAMPSPEAPTRDITYRDFGRRLVQAANLFHGLGVGPNDAVSMLLPILPETFFALFGAQAAGVANPINFLLEADAIAKLLREARCRVLLGPDLNVFPGVWQKIEAIRKAVPTLTAVIRVGGPPQRPDSDALHFESELDSQRDDRLQFTRMIRGDDVAGLFHTGGTTSLPKLARHTHRGLIVQSWSNTVVLRSGPDEIYFNGLPPFHVGGATCAGLAPLSTGATVVLLTVAGYRHPQIMSNIWALVERFRPTVVGMVPTSWGAALNAPSEVFDQHQAVQFRRLGDAGGDRQGGAGQAQAAGGRRLGHDRVARLRLDESGRRRMPYRFGRPSHAVHRGCHRAGRRRPHRRTLPAGRDRQGVGARTGDLGRFDADGYLWLTGRAKDVIIRSGHNIDPLVIEEALHQHPAVEIAAAVGRPDAYAGEYPIAFVQLKPGAQVEPEELRDFVRERIAERAAVPDEVIVVAAMPLTGVGKIFKPQLRYDAARLVFERLEQSVVGRADGVIVKVGSHPEHGTFATITVPGSDEQAIAKLRAALRPFQIRHEVRRA